MQTIPGTNIIRPAALNRPPVFGDREQIMAIYDVEHALKQFEKEQQDIGAGKLKKYNVTITYSGEYETTVQANSRDEAEEIARDVFSVHDADIDIDYLAAREVNPN